MLDDGLALSVASAVALGTSSLLLAVASRWVGTVLATAAKGHGVQLAPGPLFAPEGGLERYVRLPFSHDPATLTEAVDRIAEAWAELPHRRRPGRSAGTATALVT